MKRYFEILNFLLENEKPLIINDIAREFNVSNKTIRTDLKKIEDFLLDKDVSLIKKPGFGVKLNGSKEQKQKLKNEIRIHLKNINVLTKKDRLRYVLTRLLLNDERITINDLSKELFLSRMTVHNLLKKVEEWLKEYDLELIKKTNYGIKINGNEKSWRNAVANLVINSKDDYELKELLYEDYTGRIDYKTIKKLKKLLDLDYKKLESILTETENKLKFKFSDEGFVSLIMHLAIAIKRIKQGKDIKLSNKVMNNLISMEEYSIAKDMADMIGSTFQISLPQAEIGYILLHILGAKMQEKVDDDFNIKIYEKDEDLSVKMAKEIIKIAENALMIDYSEDKQLLNGLILHLRPTINRVKYGLTLRNPILEEIKENYPETFGAAWLTTTVFNKYLGKRINEEEIGYIALHLGAATLRQRKPLRALVVCTSGIGTSQILSVKIEKFIKDLKIADMISVVNLEQRDMSDIDILISTVPLDIEMPYVYINPLLTEDDVIKLNYEISKLRKKQKQDKNLIDRDLIFYNKSFENKEEVINFICEKLMQKNIVQKNYIVDVMKREKISSTAVGRGVAIPHGDVQLVNKTTITIIKLKKKIVWGNELVDLIIFPCISESDIKKTNKLFRILYKRIFCFDLDEQIRKARSQEEIIKIMEGILC